MNNKIMPPTITTPVTATNNDPGDESFVQVMNSTDSAEGSDHPDPLELIVTNGIINDMVEASKEDAKKLEEIMNEE